MDTQTHTPEECDQTPQVVFPAEFWEDIATAIDAEDKSFASWEKYMTPSQELLSKPFAL